MRTNAMLGFGKLASISPDFDVNALPDFDDEVPTASNLVSKKEKTKQNHQNISPQQSVSKKRNRKVAARKTSTIRDRIKQYEKISNKAKEEHTNSVIKTSKSAENTTDKTKETKNDKNINIYTDKIPPPTLKKQTNSMSERAAFGLLPLKKQMFSEIESEMLSPIIISPMNSAISANTSTPTDLFAMDKDDSCATPKFIVIQSKSEELTLNGHGADAPPPAYTAYDRDVKATNSPPTATDDMSISKDASISFDAVYEPSYGNDVVSFPILRRGTAHRGSDGNVIRDAIKQQIAEKEERKAKLRRRHSKFTEFDAKNRGNINLWGRKMNSFATKHGQQAIIEWRFASSDNMTHTLVLQHEQIKKKRKSKRMVILDGKERYSHKSKQSEFRLCVPGCGDVLEVSIEYRKVKGIKYAYRLKINDMPYSVVFHKWSKAHR